MTKEEIEVYQKLYEWEKTNNPFFPNPMRYEREDLISFAKEFSQESNKELLSELEDLKRDNDELRKVIDNQGLFENEIISGYTKQIEELKKERDNEKELSKRLKPEEKQRVFHASNITKQDKEKLVELIQLIKSDLVNSELSESVYLYFGKIFTMIEKELLQSTTQEKGETG